MSMQPEKVEALVGAAIGRLRDCGMRRTAGLEALLRHMASCHRPATLADLQAVPTLTALDQATVYRLVSKLEQSGLVRRLGLHDRAPHFQLVVPGHHHDYLVCTECGKIEDLPLHCPVEALEHEIMKKSGYRKVYHELEFFGVCPECALRTA